MNTNQIRLEIQERISEIDETFPANFSKSFNDKAIDNDIDKLEKLLKKVKLLMKSNYVFLITIAVSLIAVLIKKNIDGIDRVSSLPIGILILLIASFIRGGFMVCQVKLNLENKIYLLKLLEKIEPE